MRIPFILLSLFSPEALSGCPAIFDGVNSTEIEPHVDGFSEVIDTVCGRRNFTSFFWSEHFRDIMLAHVASQRMFDTISEKAANRPFKALLHSLDEHVQSINNSEAKEYLNAVIKNQEDFHNGIKETLMGKRSIQGYFQGIAQMISNAFALKTTHQLSVEAQIVLAQTFKQGYQYEETTEMKTARIETAMQALQRINIASDSDRVALLFSQMYLLAKEKSLREIFSKEKTSFEEFSGWMTDHWNVTDASVLEILPAVETLYLQYRTMNNTKAKAFVNGILATQIFMNTHVPYHDEEDTPKTLKLVGEVLKEDHARDVYRVCPSRNALQCYHKLPEASQTALTNAFPELAAYLSATDWFEKWRAKLSMREIDESLYAKKNATKPFRRFIAIIPKNSF